MDSFLLNKISRCCGDIEARIHACRDRQVAVMLKERLFQEFEAECKSEIVRQVVIRYADELIAKTFDQNGMNKYLEE